MFEPEILKGLVDIHLHVAPSLIPRAADVVTVARQAEEAGYRAIIIKDHHYNSAPVCNQVKKYLFSDSKLDIFGSISLNNSVGGVSPYVVESAIGFGVRIVWMPTVSAAQHIAFHSGGNAFPKTSKKLMDLPITMLDSCGHLKTEVKDVINVIAQAPQVVLATGHGNAKEVDAIVSCAAKAGIRNIVVDHPTFGIGATVDDMKRWVEMGCWIEHCGTISHPDIGDKQTPPEQIAELIEILGTEHTILSSDFGQLRFGNCIEGMDGYLHQLKLCGVDANALKTMCQDNPSRMLGLV